MCVRGRKGQARHRHLSPFLTLSGNRGVVLGGKGDASASGPPGPQRQRGHGRTHPLPHRAIPWCPLLPFPLFVLFLLFSPLLQDRKKPCSKCEDAVIRSNVLSWLTCSHRSQKRFTAHHHYTEGFHD
ncbi:hypothetical protein GOX2543 (plasmid) [Gluconobacter oxydans 621H]|uniref:Uncharacterized protein n=1 Tax=Gluconobacter oxydans (strain 621H) TaxID=290633 RepID=Q5HXZ4_GLUOX|nr:hypothetical protein GOX2543 [Gluconobacter oxydans 621H]